MERRPNLQELQVVLTTATRHLAGEFELCGSQSEAMAIACRPGPSSVNRSGGVSGPTLLSLADIAGALYAMSTSNVGRRIVTSSFRMDFFRPTPPAGFTIDITPMHQSSRRVVCDIRFNDGEHCLAQSMGTFVMF